MRLFGYYALHSFKNQIKKLFKTWVFVFILVCMVIGGVIGVGAAVLSEHVENDNETSVEAIDEDTTDDIISDNDVSEEDINASLSTMDTYDFIELIAGAIILIVFIFEALSADKNGGKIFMPADVNLLFSSPMKPQSVLMFRLMTQLGLAVVASIYMLFQIPNLVLNLGLSLWSAIAIIIAWCMTIVIGKLLQVLLYVISASNPKYKPMIRRGVYLIIALIIIGYAGYWKSSGMDNITAAIDFFNGSVSRFIPFWGWLKAFCLYAVLGNLPACLAFLAALILGGTLLIYSIWHIQADFYEDAMAKSEETAELLEKARSEKSSDLVLKKRKKDRSDKLKRDGMNHGWGASVFFHKTMYNRFRFAHLGFFTKTMETYLVAAIGVSLFCKYIAETNSLIPTALTLGIFAFYRSLGNPLEKDVQMDYFLLIPENTWSKLFFSMMGGLLNCILDLIPGMLAAVILLRANPLTAFVWIIVIVTVDFFATSVGTFIGVSVPTSAGKTLKQIIQVMFVYFGLLPDIAIMAVGLVFHFVTPAVIGVILINVILGGIFFALSPLFINPD